MQEKSKTEQATAEKVMCACGHEEEKSMTALSRRDNTTILCSECGTREALSDYLSRRA